MILYTPVSCGSIKEERYYIKFGQMISHLLEIGNAGFNLVFDYPEEFAISPYNPFFASELFTWDFTSGEDRAFFLQLLSAMSPIQLVELYTEGGEMYAPVRYPLPLYPSSDSTLAPKYSIFLEFLAHYLLPQYWDDYITVHAIDDDPATIDDSYNLWFAKFLSVMAATQSKYFPLIECLIDKEGKLLDQVKTASKTTTRYNDTPQNTGTFEDPQHNTTFQASENAASSDMETPIRRLKEIRDNIENYYNAWALDFDRIFLKEGAIE